MHLRTRLIGSASAVAGVLLALGAMDALSAQKPQPVGSPVAEAAAVRAARGAQNMAIGAGDLDSIASFWTDDVAIRRGLGQAVTGRAALRALFGPTGANDSSLVYQRLTTGVEISAQWPLAFETGTWIGHVGNVKGPAAIRGRYSAQWVKRNGRWLIRAEVFVALACSGVGCRSVAAP